MNNIKKVLFALIICLPLMGCSKKAYSYDDFKDEFSKVSVNQIHYSTRLKADEIKGTNLVSIALDEAGNTKKIEELNKDTKEEGIKSSKDFFDAQKEIILNVLNNIKAEASSSKLSGELLYRVEIKNNDKFTYFTINNDGSGSIEKDGVTKYYTITNYEDFASFYDKFQTTYDEEVWKYM